jgi:hypothetical protein
VEASSPRKAFEKANKGVYGMFPRHQVLPPGDFFPDHLGDPSQGDWRDMQIGIGDSIKIEITRVK